MKKDLGEDYLHQLVRKNKDYKQVVVPTFHTGNSVISSEGVGQLLHPWLPSVGQCCEKQLLHLYLYEIQPLIHILGNF